MSAVSLNSEGRWFLVRTHLGYWDAFRVSTSASCSSVELCKTPRKDYGSRIIQSMIDYSSIGYVRQSTDLCWSLVTHQKDATNCANRRSLPLTSHDLMSNKNHCTQPYLPYLVLRSQLERLGPRGAASSQPVLVKVMGGRRVGWDVSRGIPKWVGFGTLQLLCRCRYYVV